MKPIPRASHFLTIWNTSGKNIYQEIIITKRGNFKCNIHEITWYRKASCKHTHLLEEKQ